MTIELILFEILKINCLFVNKYQIDMQVPEASYSRVIWKLIKKNDLQKIFGPHVLVCMNRTKFNTHQPTIFYSYMRIVSIIDILIQNFCAGTVFFFRVPQVRFR